MTIIAMGCGVIVVGFVVLIVAVGIVASRSSSNAASPVSTAVAPASTTAPVADAKPTAAPAPTVAAAQPTAAPKPTAAPPTATTPPQPKPATLAKVGERVESAGVALTVNSVKRMIDAGQFSKAKPGRTFAVADVTIETTGRDKAPYNPLYFKAKDADGFEYSGSLFGGDNSLKSGELGQGDKVRGTVMFDIPEGAKGLILSYQPSVIFGGYQTIRISLD